MPLDPVFHGLAIFPRRTFFTLLEETCEAPVVGSLVRLLGGIPLPRKQSRLGDIEAAIGHALDTRGLVVFYPEGECFLGNQKIYPFKAGACYFALKYNVPIVPVVTVLTRMHGPLSKLIHVEAHVLEPLWPPPNSFLDLDLAEQIHETEALGVLSAAIKWTRELHATMQAEIDRSGGDNSLYRGPMPRIKGVND